MFHIVVISILGIAACVAAEQTPAQAKALGEVIQAQRSMTAAVGSQDAKRIQSARQAYHAAAMQAIRLEVSVPLAPDMTPPTATASSAPTKGPSPFAVIAAAETRDARQAIAARIAPIIIKEILP